jgi:hypothetical protein
MPGFAMEVDALRAVDPAGVDAARDQDLALDVPCRFAGWEEIELPDSWKGAGGPARWWRSSGWIPTRCCISRTLRASLPRQRKAIR